MRIRCDIPLLDDLVGSHAGELGADRQAYTNHCYRVWNLAVHLAGCDETSEELLTIACAFHDIGIWADRTFDYLEPSVRRARRWLRENRREGDTARVTAIIENHHKVTSVRSDALVEAFRRADWIDVTLGARRFGVPFALVDELQETFPNRGFHWRLVQLSARRLVTDPLRPLPMFRW